ncbi:MAG TPA: hypothetical protein VHU80_00070 [Polyangiaceae bacterium]|nr:hypothetical protein [Polyangiaceae bacterium]
MTTFAEGSSAHPIRTGFRYVLTAVMMGAGALHFTAGELFVQIVPPELPAPYALVWLLGIAELLLGASLQFRVTRRLAGVGLVALYVAVFPANVYMTLENVQVHGLPSYLSQPSPMMLWLRLPLQLVFIAWALWVAEIWPEGRR